MLILKQNAANSVPTPPAGKGTIFLDDSDTLSVKTSDGNVETFPTVAASNAQVVFMNGTSLSGEAALTYNFNTNVLNVSGNVAAGNVLTNNLLYANGSAWELGNVGGSDTQIQFNDNGSFGGDSGFTYNKTTDAATLAGTMTAGNLSTGGTVTATGNVSGGNLTTAGLVSATGNVTGGNLTTAGIVSATGNVSGGNLTTAGLVNATGNVTGGNLTTAGLVNATGNVTGGNLTTAGKVVASTLESNVSTGTAPFVVASTTQVANLNAATAGTAGTVTTAAQPNITSVGNLTALVMAGNLTPATDDTYDLGNTTHRFKDIWLSGNSIRLGGATISANATSVTITNPQGGNTSFTGSTTSNNSSIVNGTSNVVAAASGNVTTSVAGAANVFTVTSTGANVSGYANITGNANVGNLGTAQVLASANVTAPQLISNVSTGTAPFVVASQTKVTNLNADLLDGLSTNSLNTGLTIVNRDADGSFAANIITATLSGAATTAGTVTTASQPNITSVGTLSSLAVTGNATAGNVYANAGTIGASLLTGTLTTASQPNITSVGTLSSLTATGNVAAGNLTTTGVLSVTGTGVSSIAGNLDMTSNTIINLATPTNASDAATKQYVDDVAQGLNVHDAAAAATTGTLATATGGTITYNNGTSGVGATLTTTGTYTTIDGVNIATVGTRVLVKNEANAAHNGIYTYTSSTVLTRATDYDSVPEVEAGDFIFVTGGTVYDNTGWVQTSTVATIGTDAIDFTQFSGAGTYNAGTGLTLTGTTFSVNASQTQVTSVGTLGTLNVTGNANVGNIGAAAGVFTTVSGNGAALTDLNASNVSSGTLAQARLANASVTLGSTALTLGSTVTTVAGLTSVTSTTFVGALTGAATTAGTVTTASQPNITSVGTLTSLSVTGNANVGNIGAAAGVFTTVAGSLTTASQPNVTSLGTLTSLGVSGAVTASTLVSNVATGTAPLTVTSTTRVANLNVAYANVADFVNISDVSTGTYYPMLANAATGNISEGSNSALTFNAATGTLSSTVFSGAHTGNGNGLSSIQGANVVGTISSTTLGNSSLFIGTTSIALNRGTGAQSLTGITSIDGYAATVSTAAQPNITSVGTLTSLSSSGNIVAPNVQANTGYFISSVNAAVSAAGTAQGNATVISREVNVVSTVASGAGVALPTAVAGMRITLINTSANALLVYPASGGTINSLALNAAFSQPASGKLDFVATSTTQWYTLNATYA